MDDNWFLAALIAGWSLLIGLLLIHAGLAAGQSCCRSWSFARASATFRFPGALTPIVGWLTFTITSAATTPFFAMIDIDDDSDVVQPGSQIVAGLSLALVLGLFALIMRATIPKVFAARFLRYDVALFGEVARDDDGDIRHDEPKPSDSKKTKKKKRQRRTVGFHDVPTDTDRPLLVMGVDENDDETTDPKNITVVHSNKRRDGGSRVEASGLIDPASRFFLGPGFWDDAVVTIVDMNAPHGSTDAALPSRTALSEALGADRENHVVVPSSMWIVGFHFRFGELYTAYGKGFQWWAAMDFLHIILIAVFHGWRPPVGDCSGQSIAIVVLLGIRFLAILILGPHRTSHERSWSLALNFVELGGGCTFTLLYHHLTTTTTHSGTVVAYHRWALEVGTIIAFVLMFLSVVHCIAVVACRIVEGATQRSTKEATNLAFGAFCEDVNAVNERRNAARKERGAEAFRQHELLEEKRRIRRQLAKSVQQQRKAEHDDKLRLIRESVTKDLFPDRPRQTAWRRGDSHDGDDTTDDDEMDDAYGLGPKQRAGIFQRQRHHTHGTSSVSVADAQVDDSLAAHGLLLPHHRQNALALAVPPGNSQGATMSRNRLRSFDDEFDEVMKRSDSQLPAENPWDHL